MQKCSICDKEIYGHSTPAKSKKRVKGESVIEQGPVVCGSCPLNKSQGATTGKSFSEVRMDLAKIVTKKVPDRQEIRMTGLKVKSNVKNRTILLDGRHAIVFDENGLGTLAPQHVELFEREMAMRPGRFSFVENEPDVVETAAIVVAEPEAVLEVAPEEVPAPVSEVVESVEEAVLEVAPEEVPAPEQPLEEVSQPVAKKTSKKK